MSRKIKIWRDPYDEGFDTCSAKTVEFKPGLTVLVGCNGAGKSTMLHNIKDELKKEKIPTFTYDNQTDGKGSVEMNLFNGNVGLAATRITSSEGENISFNLGEIAFKWGKFLRCGDVGDPSAKIQQAIVRSIWGDESEEEEEMPNERWILLDAMDSGFSIDNVIEMKDLFQLVLNDAKQMGIELYIVISSNEYELVDGSECLDVTSGKYIQFKTYSEYKEFILETRKQKNKRFK